VTIVTIELTTVQPERKVAMTAEIGRRAFLSGAMCSAGAVAVAAMLGAPAAGDEAPASAEPVTPADALERLRAGNGRFAAGQAEAPQRDLARLRATAPLQKPFAAVLGCADSRVPVELIYDQGFGDIFVVRVAGNVAASAEIASLEYATRVLGSIALVVLGHGNCGAVKAALQGAEVPGQISTLYHLIAPALRRKTMTLDEAIAANVRYQARKLAKGSTVLSRLIAQRKLTLVGGVFDLQSGMVKPIEL